MVTLSTRRTPRSLALRLVLSATVLCGGVLIVTGILLVGLFRQHVEHRFDSTLRHDLVHLVSIARLTAAGSLQINNALSGALFNKPYSGWAWQVRSDDRILRQSLSLGPMAPGVMEVLNAPRDIVGAFTAPGNIPSRGLSRGVKLHGTTESLTFAVAYPQSEIDEALTEFTWAVLITLSALGIGLVATNILLMRVALRPLIALRSKVACMREGKAQVLVEWPSELQPIADELEGLQTHVNRLVERARGQAADLAHAVKTPLAVLQQLTVKAGPSVAKPLQGQLDRISAYLDRHLGRSRMAGTARHQTSVAGSVDDILFALSHDLTRKGITVHQSIQSGLNFVGDEADFYELLGNLLDNASKWARSRIAVTAEMNENFLRLEVADDGPGVPPDQRDLIFARGTRLDEGSTGQGLGLTIVRDIADLYQGDVVIGESELGGAAISLTLPGAFQANEVSSSSSTSQVTEESSGCVQ